MKHLELRQFDSYRFNVVLTEFKQGDSHSKVLRYWEGLSPLMVKDFKDCAKNLESWEACRGEGKIAECEDKNSAGYEFIDREIKVPSNFGNVVGINGELLPLLTLTLEDYKRIF